MAATRAQKIRLSLFLIVTTTILVATIIYLVGASLMQVRDEYFVILEGSSGGLEPGSQVRLNEIMVGRVESVKLDPNDPGTVRIAISLDHDTPITVDTVAVPEMANITGSKLLSMHGGTKNSQRLKPGDTIKSAASDFSMLSTRVVSISKKLDDLIDNLKELTNEDNLNKVSSILNELEQTTNGVNLIVAENRDEVGGLIQDARNVLYRLDSSLGKFDMAVGAMERTINAYGSTSNVKNVSTILEDVQLLVANVTSRSSEEELGQTIQSVNKLLLDSNVAVMSMRTDLQRIIREAEVSVESFNELMQILIENPSVLISGRGEKERQLP